MTFKVLIAKNALSSIPNERREQIKNALKELESPSEGGNLKKLKGYKTELFRMRIGDYRAFYTIDFENKIGYNWLNYSWFYHSNNLCLFHFFIPCYPRNISHVLGNYTFLCNSQCQ